LKKASRSKPEDLINLLNLQQMPEIWGSHGYERRLPDGTYLPGEINTAAQEGLRQAEKWAESVSLEARLEKKPAGLAFHWRGMEDSQAERIKSMIESEWKTRASEYNLKLLNFDCGIELKLADIDKGNAVRDILDEITAGSAIAYLGDDITDEDAFRALSGKGLSVLVRPELRDTTADLWIKPTSELIDFLILWDNSCQTTNS
jgi:trehalose-phosphatase